MEYIDFSNNKTKLQKRLVKMKTSKIIKIIIYIYSPVSKKNVIILFIILLVFIFTNLILCPVWKIKLSQSKYKIKKIFNQLDNEKL